MKEEKLEKETCRGREKRGRSRIYQEYERREENLEETEEKGDMLRMKR
jgi:hypothetical protein